MRLRTKETIDRLLQAIERRVWGFTWRDLFRTEKAKREQIESQYGAQPGPAHRLAVIRDALAPNRVLNSEVALPVLSVPELEGVWVAIPLDRHLVIHHAAHGTEDQSIPRFSGGPGRSVLTTPHDAANCPHPDCALHPPDEEGMR